jgi:CBS domain-containing protein
LLKHRHHIPLITTAEDLAREPISINHNSTIYDAIEKIIECNISGVLVRGTKARGILSQKEIASVLLTEEKNIREIPAEEKMLDAVPVDRFAPLSNCADIMLRQKTNALAIKEGCNIGGILTKHDIVRHYYENYGERTSISDAMSVGSFFVSPDTVLYDALKKMYTNQISRILIKDGGDKPVGIATFKNFLNCAVYHSNRYDNNTFLYGFGKKIPISQIMTKNIITVSTKTTLARVAKILIEYRIHGVAVTSGQKIIGFVTEKDIVRHVAKMGI